MKAKLSLSIIVVIVVSLLVYGAGLAAEDVSNPEISTGVRGLLKYGEITEIGSETFSIKIRDGGIYTYLVDGDTRFRIRDNDEPRLSDLEPSSFVIVAAKVDGDELVARIVAIVPEDINPAKWFGVRARGEVVDVDSEAGKVTVLKPTGEKIVFDIDPKTRFLGAASSLGELEIGWYVGVAAGEKTDGSFTVLILTSTENLRHVRKTGIVSEIDLDSESVSISAHNGDEVNFNVNSDTNYYSRGNQVEGLSDLEVDMVVVIVARFQTDGSYLATQIAAANAEDLPNYEVKAGGQIIELGTNYFIILSQSGTEVTFNVDLDTSFRGRGLDIQSLDDVEVGMVALVGGDLEENGEILAKLVIGIQYNSEE